MEAGGCTKIKIYRRYRVTNQHDNFLFSLPLSDIILLQRSKSNYKGLEESQLKMLENSIAVEKHRYVMYPIHISIHLHHYSSFFMFFCIAKKLIQDFKIFKKFQQIFVS